MSGHELPASPFLFAILAAADDDVDAQVLLEALEGAVRDERNDPEEPLVATWARLAAWRPPHGLRTVRPRPQLGTRALFGPDDRDAVDRLIGELLRRRLR